MLKRIGLIVAISLSLAACCGSDSEKRMGGDANERATSAFYKTMLSADDGEADVAMLNLFFNRMPKGGDIHHHYTGTLYAETYLEWVAARGWYINSCTLKIVKKKLADKQCPDLSVDELLKQNTLYRKLLTLWSDKDYANHFHDQPPPDSNFFNTFGYFGPVSNDYMDLGLQILKQRAIKENVSYIETMLSSVGASSKEAFDEKESAMLNAELITTNTPEALTTLFDQIAAKLDASNAYRQSVQGFVSRVDEVHQGIDDGQFTLRFQTYAARTKNPLDVFTDLYSGFQASKASPLVVGVNIVAPENNHIALRDYTLHMRMFEYLHARYPEVSRALHAGELTLGMVRPKDLLFHITEARQIANAQRIGHGVDLPYEEDPLALLKDIKLNAAIEINLTSNQFILGVQGSQHPYQIYADYGVPLVIATDDSGVSRNNLANEYMLLASRYNPSYTKIKSYVYNSIKLSFMSDDDKAKIKSQLDKKFKAFEEEMAGFWGGVEVFGGRGNAN